MGVVRRAEKPSHKPEVTISLSSSLWHKFVNRDALLRMAGTCFESRQATNQAFLKVRKIGFLFIRE